MSGQEAQTVEQILKNGKVGLEDAVKRRAKFGNNKAQVADNSVKVLSEEERKNIREIISELSIALQTTWLNDCSPKNGTPLG